MTQQPPEIERLLDNVEEHPIELTRLRLAARAVRAKRWVEAVDDAEREFSLGWVQRRMESIAPTSVAHLGGERVIRALRAGKREETPRAAGLGDEANQLAATVNEPVASQVGGAEAGAPELSDDELVRAWETACVNDESVRLHGDALARRLKDRREERRIEHLRWCEVVNSISSERDALRAEVDAIARAMQPVGVRYMDPPDGGDVTLVEQVSRLVAEVERLRPVVEAVRVVRDEHRSFDAMIAAFDAYRRVKDEP